MQCVKVVVCLLFLQPSVAMAAEDNANVAGSKSFGRSPEQLMPLLTVEGDSLDPVYKVTTFDVTTVTIKGLFGSTAQENSFLRGWVDRKTGEITAQVYHSVNYEGNDWRFFNRSTYAAPDGLKEVELVRIDTDVDCYRSGCSYYETVGLDIPFATLLDMAASYNPASPNTGLRYRLFSKSGQQLDDVIYTNEIVAFTRKLKEIADKVPVSKP
jgi:hypothetical protein